MHDELISASMFHCLSFYRFCPKSISFVTRTPSAIVYLVFCCCPHHYHHYHPPSPPPPQSSSSPSPSSSAPHSGELRTQKLKSHLVRTQSLNVLPLKPGVGQYIAIHAKLTASDFFLAYFYLPVHSLAFFPIPLPIFPVLAVANTRFLCRPAK